MIGSSLLLPDRFLQPDALAEMIAAERPTFAAAVPTIWQGLDRYLRERPRDITSLREVLIGGSAVPPALMHAFEEELGVPGLHVTRRPLLPICARSSVTKSRSGSCRRTGRW